MTITEEKPPPAPAPRPAARQLTEGEKLEKLRSRIRTVAAVTAIFAIFTVFFWKQVANSNDLAPAPPANSVSSLDEPAPEPEPAAYVEPNRARDPSIVEWLFQRAKGGDNTAYPLVERILTASLRQDGRTIDVRTTIDLADKNGPIYAGDISNNDVALMACNAGVAFGQQYYTHPGAVLVVDIRGSVVAGRASDDAACSLVRHS